MSNYPRPSYVRCAPILLAAVVGLTAFARADDMPHIKVSADQRSFILMNGKPFAPWGFNYDHDESGRLLEDYWDKEWSKVEKDFGAMHDLGANVVRIHLQFAKFMKD